MRVVLDRDSVAMGDDLRSHRHTVDVPDGASLEELFRSTAPDAHVTGSTWVAVWNGTWVALFSHEWGTGRVWDDRFRSVADLPGEGGAATLFWVYWSGMDAEWLLERLRASDDVDRASLEAEWAPVRAQRHEQALRERERTNPGRLFDGETVAALEGFGVRWDVHTDAVCRFFVDALDPDARWWAGGTDTMTVIWTPSGRCGNLRPVALAQVWMVALVASAVTGRGAEALGPPVVESAVKRSGVLTVTRTVGDRQELAQLPDEAHVEFFRRTLGRSVAEVAAAFR